MEAKADLTATEYATISNDLKDNDASGETILPKKRKTGRYPKAECPEAKQLRTSRKLRRSSLRTMKKKLDNANTEIRQVDDVLSRLGKRGTHRLCQTGLAKASRHSEMCDRIPGRNTWSQ